MNTLQSNTNQIVMNHLIRSYIHETDKYIKATRNSNHHVIFAQKMIHSVLDMTKNSNSESIIVLFCDKYTDKTNILLDVQFDEKNPVATLEFTTQEGKKYYMQDFSHCYFKL